MHISSDMLRRGILEQGVSVTVFGNVSGELSLSHILFSEAGNPFEDGAVYLVSGGESKLRPARKNEPKIKSVAMIAGNYDVEFIRRFEAVFIAEEGTALPSLHNKIQRVFDHYDIWSRELRLLLNTGSNVQAMIDSSTSVMGNPLIMQDSNFNVIAVSTEFAANPSLAPILDHNNIPYMMKAERSAGGAEERANVVPLQITGRHALYTNIFQQGRFQYRLLVLEMEGELHASASTLLEYISGYIQLAIGYVVDESKEFQALPFVMKSILSGEYRDTGFIEQRLAEYGWLKEQVYVCAQIHAELADYKNRTMRFMSDRLTAIYKDACIFEYENKIAAFFNLSRADADIRSIEKSLTGFLQDNNMKAGISNTFSEFEYLRQYYTQAGVAIKLGPRLKPYQWLHRFGDVKEQYILESCTEQLPALMICDPGLLKLRAYDEKHKQDLYHTLFVFLKNNMRSVGAAKELFIHRSTFLYRLERIKEITGLSFESDSNQWYLLLSYKLLEKEKQR
ncbi:MAG: helix-turn-helix domain-containing protein [Clostridiales Family XIII bacterium]|jgi:hypothetical protein|nr:helix-turn-helix domain-containing protein [Clostridiales Family XIII bacterium]